MNNRPACDRVSYNKALLSDKFFTTLQIYRRARRYVSKKMSPEKIEQLIRKIISEGLLFPWWSYLLVVIATFAGGFLGAYFKRKGENLATKQDYESLLNQVKKTTSATESIKINLSKGNWLHQQSWYLKEKYYTGLLESLYLLKLSLSARLDHYMEPDSQYSDDQINESPHYKKQIDIGSEALQQLQRLHGPAEMVVSKRAIQALNEFYGASWHANNFSACNNEYLTEVTASVEKTHKVVLEEARSDLR